MPSIKNPNECTVQVTTIKPSTAGLGQTSITSLTSQEEAKFSVKATASLGQSTVSLKPSSTVSITVSPKSTIPEKNKEQSNESQT